MIVSPGRICLFGDHADCHGFPVIAMTIDREIFLKYHEGHSRLNGGSTALLEACIKAMKGHPIGKLDISTEATLPASRGLSSSAALCNGIIQCYNSAFNLGLGVAEVAALSYNAESKLYGSMCGQMDMYASAIGGITYIDCSTEPPKWKQIEVRSLPLIVADTGVKREIAPTLRKKREEYLTGDKVTVDAIDNINIIVQKAKDALRSGNQRAVGELMNESQKCLEKYGVCHPRNTELIDAVRQHVFGAKITGGGMGGCILAYGGNLDKAEKELTKLDATVYRVNVGKGLRESNS